MKTNETEEARVREETRKGDFFLAMKVFAEASKDELIVKAWEDGYNRDMVSEYQKIRIKANLDEQKTLVSWDVQILLFDFFHYVVSNYHPLEEPFEDYMLRFAQTFVAPKSTEVYGKGGGYREGSRTKTLLN